MTTTLVTGGTGTIGQALVRRLLRSPSNEVIVYSRDEFKQLHMRERLGDHPGLFFVLCVNFVAK